MSTPRLIVAAALLVACSAGYHDRALPRPVSAPPKTPGTGYLTAGFGKADFTPPPGVGLAGNGPEGLRTTGWRTHLFARALVLEDPAGERMAFVVVDLAHVSPSLHRGVAAMVVEETGIGADRLIVSASHTHSSTSHFYAEALYNGQSSRVDGYDPRLERLLVTRTAKAVRDANAARRRAWAAWAIDSITDATRNRSITAYCTNDPEPVICSRDSLSIASEAQNHQLAVLRIDTVPPNGHPGRPAAILSAYAIHGTGNPNTTTLLDGDIHGAVMRDLERRLDSANGGKGSVALFLNGTEGDASPRLSRDTRCPVPALGPALPFTPVRGMARQYDFIRLPEARMERCLWNAWRALDSLGLRIADGIWNAATTGIHGAALNDQVTIRRSFRTIDLPGFEGLCASGQTGSAGPGGAEDAQTRIWKWEPFAPLFQVSLREGDGAVLDPPRGCQQEKKPALGLLQTLVAGDHGAPEVAQFTVATVGDVVLASVPAEPTTMAGIQLRRAVAAGLGGGTSIDRVVVIGLANGFLQYVTTSGEYRVQSYEGASNLYGPRTAAVFSSVLGGLASELALGGPSPPAVVGPIVAYPGRPKEIMPDSVGKLGSLGKRSAEISCRNGAIRVQWWDLEPGRVLPWNGQPMVRVKVDDMPPVEDGDPGMAIQVVRGKPGGTFRWEATLPVARTSTTAEATLLARDGVREEAPLAARLSCGPSLPAGR